MGLFAWGMPKGAGTDLAMSQPLGFALLSIHNCTACRPEKHSGRKFAEKIGMSYLASGKHGPCELR